MVAKAKVKATKDTVVTKCAKATALTNPDSISNLATGFRNLMKYRASEACKKALTVWGS